MDWRGPVGQCPPICLQKILDQNDYGNVQRFMIADRKPRSPCVAECEGLVKISFSSVLWLENVADHFPGCRQRGPVGGCLSPVLCHGSRRVHGTPASPVWLLQSALAGHACSLLGDRHAHYLIGRAILILAKPAVADGLLDRNETCDASDLQSPRHYRDRPHSRHSPRSLLSRLARTHAPVE
jgi:hypothetical protein